VSDPVRYGSRYSSAVLAAPRGCLVCGAPLRSARAEYCSPGCKQRAYRLRQIVPPAGDAAARASLLKHRQRLVAQTIYECPTCGEHYLGERRCPDCNRFCRALGLGGACPHCDQPILVAELLGGEGVL
jgi:ribosomal protein L32